MKLTGQAVDDIFKDCLFREDELVDGSPPGDFVAVEGIMARIGFHPERLESHRDEVVELLNQLPDEFHILGGGGWSFLNACNDKDGELWTGEQAVVDELFMLGIALEYVTYALDREMWAAFPGGVPYVIVDAHEPPPKEMTAEGG